MGSRINLFFETSHHKELEKNINDLTCLRLQCDIQCKTINGWTQPFSGIIDTGAHTSVIPHSLQKLIVHETCGSHKIYGMSTKEECAIPVTIDKVT
jgi:hypothetical protein